MSAMAHNGSGVSVGESGGALACSIAGPEDRQPRSLETITEYVPASLTKTLDNINGLFVSPSRFVPFRITLHTLLRSWVGQSGEVTTTR